MDYIEKTQPLTHKRAFKQALILALPVNLLVFTFFVVIQLKGDVSNIGMQTLYDFAIRYVFNVIVFYILYEYCFWVFRKEWYFRKKHLIGLIGVFCLAMIISFVASNVQFQVLQMVQKNLHNYFIFGNILKDLGASIVVLLSTLSISSLYKNQQITIENQSIILHNQVLLIENAKSCYEVLKNQLRPHFAFNALNTLEGLIDIDKVKAVNYLQNLSFLFRYIVQEKDIVTLREEMEFAKSYAYLMQIRYGDNLRIEYAVEAKYDWHYVMSFGVQLLLENAIKHNVIDDKNPLTIRIETTENETIKISNPIQPKIEVEASKGIGLSNLSNRYKLEFGETVIVTRNGFFTVEIPLVKEKSKSRKV